MKTYGTPAAPEDPRLTGEARALCMLELYRPLEDGNGGLFLQAVNDRAGMNFPNLRFFSQPPLGFDNRRKT